MGAFGRLAILTVALLLLAGAAGLASIAGPGADDSHRERNILVPFDGPTDLPLAALQNRIAAHPDDAQNLTSLGFAYLQRARETGDPAFYSKAEGVFQRAQSVVPDDPSVLNGLASVALARHDFQRALDLGNRALALEPDDADIHGVIGDALIELGRYGEAVDSFQRMLDIRPDLGAFVRTSYARELHGDLPAAIAAMQLAVDAAGLRGESAAWPRLQLGHLYFTKGDLDLAGEQYEAALESFPGYVHAIAGLARLAAARGDYEDAAHLYEGVIARQPVLEYVIALGDVYAAAGRQSDAQRQYELVAAIDQLYASNGVNTDLELALFNADHGIELENAVAQARSVYAGRPGSIHAADVLSWTLYRAGEVEDALGYSLEALRLGTQDPLLLFHAGMISLAAGDEDSARIHLARVRELNPRFSVLHAGDAARALAALDALVRN